MAEHSPSKTGVNALMSRPSTFLARVRQGVDARVKPAHDDGRRGIPRAPHVIPDSRLDALPDAALLQHVIPDNALLAR
jgi:hypothetical protein